MFSLCKEYIRGNDLGFDLSISKKKIHKNMSHASFLSGPELKIIITKLQI